MSCIIGQKPTALVGQKGVKYGLQSVFNMDDEEEKEEVYDWRKKVAEEAAKNQRKVSVNNFSIIQKSKFNSTARTLAVVSRPSQKIAII